MSDELDKLKLSAGDKAILRALKTGEDVIAVTPARLREMQEHVRARLADIEDRYPRLVTACPYETRLAVTWWVMRAMVAHAREGGSFRYLIYDRLGFDLDAYMPLLDAGGLTISNEFTLPAADRPEEGARC